MSSWPRSALKLLRADGGRAAGGVPLGHDLVEGEGEDLVGRDLGEVAFMERGRRAEVMKGASPLAGRAAGVFDLIGAGRDLQLVAFLGA